MEVRERKLHSKYYSDCIDYDISYEDLWERGSGRTTRMLVNALYQLQLTSIYLSSHLLKYSEDLKKVLMEMSYKCNLNIDPYSIKIIPYKPEFLYYKVIDKSIPLFVDHYAYDYKYFKY